MASNPINPLVPTYQGYVNSTFDALLLFEACLNGHLNHVPRRPHDRERQELIQSGNVFIYEEHASGIKRWTDGISWSPSRILGNFLIYRELDEPFPPGEKKRALKKGKHSSGGITRPDTATRTVAQLPPIGLPVPLEDQEALSKILIGSLVDSYNFKAGGLIKKTISVTVNGVPHHLVSYYSVDDIVKNRLPRPSHDKFFRQILPRYELLQKQNFRASFEEFNTPDGFPYHHRLVGTGQLQNGAVVPPSNSGYITAYSRSTASISQPSLAHAQPTANYSSGLPGYLVNGVHTHQMPSTLQMHAQHQPQNQQPLSPPQQIPQHHQMAQMPWNYPPASQAPLPGFFSTDTQMNMPNGYFDHDADGNDDIKGEPIDQDSWVMPNPSEPSGWPNSAPSHPGGSHPGHHGHHAWNGQPGSG